METNASVRNVPVEFLQLLENNCRLQHCFLLAACVTKQRIPFINTEKNYALEESCGFGPLLSDL